MSASPQRASWINSFSAATGLKPSEYGQHSKLNIRRLAWVDWPLHTRVYSIMFQQAFGYDGELGVIMSKSKFPKAPPVISPITPRGLTALLEAAGKESYIESGKEIDEDAKAAIRIDKYKLRDAFQYLEDKGLISRCRMNCLPSALVKYTMAEALKKDLITEFCDLSTKSRQALHWSKITVYLLARPKKPKAMEPYRDFSTSGDKSPLAHKSPNEPNGLQLFFSFVGDKTLAERLLKRPAVLNEIEAYDRKLTELRGSVEKMREEEQALIKKLRTFAEQAAQLNLFDEDSALPFPSLNTSGGDSIPPSSVGSEGAEQTAASNGDGNSVPGAGSSVGKQPAPTQSAEDWDLVGMAASPYVPGIDDSWVAQLKTACLAKNPTVRVREIVRLVHLKGPASCRTPRPAGHLKTSVENACHGRMFEHQRLTWRQEEERQQALDARRSQPTEEYRKPTTEELIGKCDRDIAEATERLRKAKKSGHSLEIVDADLRLYALQQTREQLERELTEVAS